MKKSDEVYRETIPTYGLTYGSLKRFLNLTYPNDDVAIDQSAIADNYKFYVPRRLEQKEWEDIRYMRTASSDDVKFFLDKKAIEQAIEKEIKKIQDDVDKKQTDSKLLQKEFDLLVKLLKDRKAYLDKSYEKIWEPEDSRREIARDMWMKYSIKICKLFRTWMDKSGEKEVNKKMKDMKGKIGLDEDRSKLETDLKNLDEKLKKLDEELNKLGEGSKESNESEQEDKKSEQDRKLEPGKESSLEIDLETQMAERKRKEAAVREKTEEVRKKTEIKEAKRQGNEKGKTASEEKPAPDEEAFMKGLFRREVQSRYQ